MTFIDLGDFKIRFDPKEVRINIDGEMIDVGARRTEKEEGLEPPISSSKDDQIIAVGDGTFINNRTRARFVKMRKGDFQ